MTIRHEYRPDIDGLRAFSIIAVVVYHAFPSLLPGGFVGVDVFFVISGYLISSIILQGLRSNSFSIVGFYRRRIQRIIPALLLVLLFCLVAGWLVLLPHEYAMLGKATGAASLFVPNILFWTEAGYFDLDSKLKPLIHLWSLGVEEQFYLVFPLVLMLANRYAIKSHYLIAALLLASFGASLFFGENPAAIFFLPQFRVWELLIGGFLAFLQLQSYDKQSNTFRALMSLGGFAMMCAATLVINRQTHFPGWWALLPTLGAAMTIGAGAAGLVNRLVLSNRIAVFIGRISFPLYLWHWPLLSFASIMEEGEPILVIRVAAVLLSIVLAWLSYRLVEKPLRYHPSPAVPVILLASLFSLGAMGILVARLDGIPSRTVAVNVAANAFMWKELGLFDRDDCSEKLGVPGRCMMDGKPAKVAILGDSHSTNVFLALVHHYRNSDTGVIRLGKGGCPPLYNVKNRSSGKGDICLRVSNGNLNWVLKNPDITTVYLSSMGPMYLDPKQQRYKMSFLDNPALVNNRDVFASALNETVSRLLGAGKELILVIDWPGLGFDPKTCADTRPVRLSGFKPRDCRVPREEYEARSADYRLMLRSIAAAHPGLKIWDTAKAFCDEQYCHGKMQGQILYRDPGHLSLEGSKYLGEHLELE